MERCYERNHVTSRQVWTSKRASHLSFRTQYAGQDSQCNKSSLPLFMARVLTDYAYYSLPSNDFTFITNLLN